MILDPFLYLKYSFNCVYWIDHAWVIIAIAQLIERRRSRLLTLRRRREPVVIIRLTNSRSLPHTRLILCKDPTILSCINQNLAKFAPSLSLCVDAQYLAQYSLCVDSHFAKLFKWSMAAVFCSWTTKWGTCCRLYPPDSKRDLSAY